MSILNGIRKDIESEMEETDEAIFTHSRIVEKLKLQRYKLVAEMEDLELNDVVECIIENDISPRRMMDLIISEIERRMDQNTSDA